MILPRWVGAIIAALRTTRSDPESVRIIQVPMRHAGVYVDHDTALKFSAVFRAIAYISQSVAGLPWDVIRETPDRTIKLVNHSVFSLLKTRPNSEMGAFTWRETLLAWALSWGNGYAEIQWDEAGRPFALWPISPDRVNVKRDPETDEILYEVSNNRKGTTYLRSEDVFHLHGLGFDGLVGYSVVSLGARSIGLSLAAEGYGEDFFANGAVTTGALEHPKTLSPKAKAGLQKDFAEKYTAKGKRFTPFIFEEGMKWNAISLPPEDSQMLQTRQFQVTDIARWFGLPPHKLADLSRATFSNIEQQSIEVVNDALMPWVHRLEQEANLKLFSGRERGVRTKINVRGLLRGDDASRAAFYQVMRNIGVYSTNTILRLEDMDPVGPEGDELLVQVNQTTLKKLVSGEVQQQQKTAEPDLQQVRQNYSGLFQDAFARILRREVNRFEQSKHKFSDRNALAQWIDELCEQQRPFMRNTLDPLVSCMLGLCDPIGIDTSGRWLGVVQAVVDEHMKVSRQLFSVANGPEMPAFDLEFRAKQETKGLIDGLFALFSRGNGHEKQIPAKT